MNLGDQAKITLNCFTSTGLVTTGTCFSKYLFKLSTSIFARISPYSPPIFVVFSWEELVFDILLPYFDQSVTYGLRQVTAITSKIRFTWSLDVIFHVLKSLGNFNSQFLFQPSGKANYRPFDCWTPHHTSHKFALVYSLIIIFFRLRTTWSRNRDYKWVRYYWVGVKRGARGFRRKNIWNYSTR